MHTPGSGKSAQQASQGQRRRPRPSILRNEHPNPACAEGKREEEEGGGRMGQTADVSQEQSSCYLLHHAMITLYTVQQNLEMTCV